MFAYSLWAWLICKVSVLIGMLYSGMCDYAVHYCTMILFFKWSWKMGKDFYCCWGLKSEERFKVGLKALRVSEGSNNNDDVDHDDDDDDDKVQRDMTCWPSLSVVRTLTLTWWMLGNWMGHPFKCTIDLLLLLFLLLCEQYDYYFRSRSHSQWS